MPLYTRNNVELEYKEPIKISGNSEMKEDKFITFVIRLFKKASKALEQQEGR